MSTAPARVPAGGGGGGLQRSAFAGSFARLSDAVANNDARPGAAAAGGQAQQQLAAVPAGAVVRLGRAFAAFCAVVEAGVTDGVARVGAAADAAFAAGTGGASIGVAGGGVGAQRLARMSSLGSFGDLARAPGATTAGIGGRRRGPSAGVVRGGGGRGLGGGGGPAAATGPSAGDNGGSGGGVGASAADLSSSGAPAPLRRSRSVLRAPLLRHDSYGGGLADANGSSNNNSGGGGGQSVPGSGSGGDGGTGGGGLQRVRSVRRLSSGRVRAVGGGAAAVFLAREGFRVKFTVEARLSAGRFGCEKRRAEAANAEEEDEDDDDEEAAAAEAAEGEVVEQAREVVEAVVTMVQAAGPLVPGTPVMVTVNAIVGVELIISGGVPYAAADPASPTVTTVRRPFTWRMQAATPDMRARIALRQAELEAAFK
ncbi:hypothetical protein HK405_013832, partial [Cladochytrium tenue]